MNEEQLKQYFAIYTDAWKLFKKYFRPVEDDSFWETLLQDAQELYQKHQHPFAKELIIKTMDEIDRIFRLGK